MEVGRTTDDVSKDGVTLHLLCVKDALRAGLGEQPFDMATMKARAFWTPMHGSIDDLGNPTLRVSCETCGGRHRLKTAPRVKAEGGLAFAGDDYAVVVDVLLDETGLVGAAALERAGRAVRRKLDAQAQRAPAAGRNDPCPCGSGKKFKKCCGGAR